MRDAAREFAAEFALELPREVGFDLALLETVLPLSRARRRKSSCMVKSDLSRLACRKCLCDGNLEFLFLRTWFAELVCRNQSNAVDCGVTLWAMRLGGMDGVVKVVEIPCGLVGRCLK